MAKQRRTKRTSAKRSPPNVRKIKVKAHARDVKKAFTRAFRPSKLTDRIPEGSPSGYGGQWTKRGTGTKARKGEPARRVTISPHHRAVKEHVRTFTRSKLTKRDTGGRWVKRRGQLTMF